MTRPSDVEARAERFPKAYSRLLLASWSVAIPVMLVGGLPLYQWRDGKAALSWLLGCVVSLAAACVAGVPVALHRAGPRRTPAETALIATAVRFVAALLPLAPLMLSGWVERGWFVLGVGVSYLALLGIDTVVVVRMLSKSNGAQG